MDDFQLSTMQRTQSLGSRINAALNNKDLELAELLINQAKEDEYPEILTRQWTVRRNKFLDSIFSFNRHPILSGSTESALSKHDEIDKPIFHSSIREVFFERIQNALNFGQISFDYALLKEACDYTIACNEYSADSIVLHEYISKLLVASGLESSLFSIHREWYLLQNPDLRNALQQNLVHSWQDHCLRDWVPEVISGRRTYIPHHGKQKQVAVLNLCSSLVTHSDTSHLDGEASSGYQFCMANYSRDNVFSCSNTRINNLNDFLYQQLCLDTPIIICRNEVTILDAALVCARNLAKKGSILFGHSRNKSGEILRRLPFCKSDMLIGDITGDLIICHPSDIQDLQYHLQDYTTDFGAFQGLLHSLSQQNIEIHLIDEIFYESSSTNVAQEDSLVFWSPFYNEPNLTDFKQACNVRNDYSRIWLKQVEASQTIGWEWINNRLIPQEVSKVSVGIIIPFKDKIELLEECLKSIFAHNDRPLVKVLAVNNSSTEDKTYSTILKLTYMYGEALEFLDVNEPFNYSRLNNLAAQRLDTDFILLLNNDVFMGSSGFIDHLLCNYYFFNASIVGAMLRFPSGCIQHNGLAVTPMSHIAVVSPLKGFEIPPLFASNFPNSSYSRLLRSHECTSVTAACLLVKRSDFLQIDGLDEDLRVAYNDVDFCLRMRDHFPDRPIICVTDVVAEHRESESRGYDQTPDDTARLHRERVLLCSKHRKVFTGNDPLVGFPMNSDIPQCQSLFDPSLYPKVEKNVIATHASGQKGLSRKAASVFVHFDRNGLISRNCLRYLHDLAQVSDIFFVSSADELAKNVDALSELKEVCHKVFIRTNSGYDFGCWSHIIQDNYEELACYEYVLLCNDSVLYGLAKIQGFFREFESLSCDFAGMTASLMPEWHMQSYFVFYRRNLFCSALFRNHWKNIRALPSKYDIIMNYEVGWSRLLIELGWKPHVFMGDSVGYDNPTHSLWKHLVDRGFPFVKRELIRDNPLLVNITELATILELKCPDVLHDVKTSAGLRLATTE